MGLYKVKLPIGALQVVVGLLQLAHLLSRLFTGLLQAGHPGAQVSHLSAMIATQRLILFLANSISNN